MRCLKMYYTTADTTSCCRKYFFALRCKFLLLYISCQLFREMFHIICTFGAVILYNGCNVRLLLVKISTEEFEKKDINGLIRYVARVKRKKPYTKSRNSNQTWLETDRNSVKTLQSLRQRYYSHIF